MVYSEAVRRYLADPPRVGPPPDGAVTYRGEAGSPEDGYFVRFWAGREGDRLVLWFRAMGCPWTIAAAARLADSATGQPLSRTELPEPPELARALAVPPERMRGVMLAEEAARRALTALEKAHGSNRTTKAGEG